MMDKLKSIIKPFMKEETEKFIDFIRRASGCKDDEEAYPC